MHVVPILVNLECLRITPAVFCWNMPRQNVKILESDAADEKVDSWTLQSLLSRHVSRSVPMCRVCDSWQEVTPRRTTLVVMPSMPQQFQMQCSSLSDVPSRWCMWFLSWICFSCFFSCKAHVRSHTFCFESLDTPRSAILVVRPVTDAMPNGQEATWFQDLELYDSCASSSIA